MYYSSNIIFVTQSEQRRTGRIQRQRYTEFPQIYSRKSLQRPGPGWYWRKTATRTSLPISIGEIIYRKETAIYAISTQPEAQIVLCPQCHRPRSIVSHITYTKRGLSQIRCNNKSRNSGVFCLLIRTACKQSTTHQSVTSRQVSCGLVTAHGRYRLSQHWARRARRLWQNYKRAIRMCHHSLGWIIMGISINMKPEHWETETGYYRSM